MIYPQVSHRYSFELNKDMNFSSAHYIDHEDAGKCRRIHGHTYFCNLTIAGNQLNDLGFLVNFSDLKELIHNQFDHYLLNDLPELEGLLPSTEVMAKVIFDKTADYLAKLDNQPVILQVFLRETPTSYVLYRGAQL